MTMTRFFTAKTFLERLGLNPNKYVAEVKQAGLELDSILTEDNLKQNRKVYSLYKLIKAAMVNNSINEFCCLREYLKEKKFKGNIAVVDIGWNGSMQKYLVELCKAMNIFVQMDGLYFGIRKDIPQTVSHGYLYQPGNLKLETKISFMQGLFESFFLSHEGSTKRYRMNQNHAEPELYEPEYQTSDPEMEAFENVQKGAASFCLTYAKSVSANIVFSANEYATNLIYFGFTPSLSEVSLFGDFRFYDTNCVFLAKPAEILYYLKHPRDLLKDFSYSVWKAGFLRRILIYEIAFKIILSLLKSVRKKGKKI